MKPGPAPIPPVERFWRNVDQSAGLFECWPWLGYMDAGYGRFVADGKRLVKAARFGYELLVGPIAAGLVLDHLCRNTACVNPAHLEPVTNRENILRGESPSAHAARQTHCVNGHEFTPENTGRYMGKRKCRICHRARNRRSYRTPRRRLDVADGPPLSVQAAARAPERTHPTSFPEDWGARTPARASG